MSFPPEIRVIQLYTPVSLENGAELKQIAMREPLVRDRIADAKDRGNEEEKEARMLALLCNLSEQDIWLLTAAESLFCSGFTLWWRGQQNADAR